MCHCLVDAIFKPQIFLKLQASNSRAQGKNVFQISTRSYLPSRWAGWADMRPSSRDVFVIQQYSLYFSTFSCWCSLFALYFSCFCIGYTIFIHRIYNRHLVLVLITWTTTTITITTCASFGAAPHRTVLRLRQNILRPYLYKFSRYLYVKSYGTSKKRVYYSIRPGFFCADTL